MPTSEHIQALLATLEPAARVVVEMMWHFHEQQMAELRALREQLAARDAELAELRAQNDKLRAMVFGRRSEKMPPISTEVSRAKEAEAPPILDLPANATEDEVAAAQTTERRKKGRAKSKTKRKDRRDAIAKLPTIELAVRVRAEQLPEGLTLDDFRKLGDGEIVYRIEHVREHLVRVGYLLEKLVEKGGDRIVQAKAPPNVIDNGAWGPSMYAHVCVSKCVDSMPLYRQERALGRAGYPVARSVLCGLFHRAANALEPIYNRLIQLVAAHPYVHADETTIRVAEAHAARDAWFWTVLSPEVIAYVFSESRSAQTPVQLLGGTAGTLLTDGYVAYDAVTGDKGRVRVGCWAHARRKFFEALPSAPEARELLALITKLYLVEHEAAALNVLGTEAHRMLRDERSRGILATIESWVDVHAATTPPKSPLGAAITYATNQRKALAVFLTDPELPLDNNIAERALRIVAVGRKNFLFVGHEEGGKNLAILQTITSTCQLHGINPYEYIRDVAVRVNTHPNARLDELLPMNWRPPPDERAPA